MSSYYCYDGEDYILGKFPDGSIGLPAWRALIESLPSLSEQSDEDPLRFLRELHRTRPNPLRIPCPRVFISHRRCDKAEALRVAWLSNAEHFDFWLDILDPKLAAASLNVTLTPYQQAVLMAAIIEMALLNCTHVLAVMTKNVRGTMWMPYEYGRVKDSALVSVRAAGWFDSSWNLTTTPEYFHLGQQWRTEGELRTWFKTQFTACKRTGASCPSKTWPFSEPPPLPHPSAS